MRNKKEFTLWLIILFIFLYCVNLYAQEGALRNDAQAAVKYLEYAQNLIEKKQFNDAYAVLLRASDFKDVLSDIPYLTAVLQLETGPASRADVIKNLNDAIDIKYWEIYSESHALLFKAEQQIITKDYHGAVNSIDRIAGQGESAQKRADAAMLRLRALRGMTLGYQADDPVLALTQFRSSVLNTMDRFPRDARPLRIFFEYAHNKISELNSLAEPGDIYLLELALRRLPFLLETDPDLGWMASALVWDLNEAKRLAGAYRAVKYPHPSSIPTALNLGLIDDDTAISELFSETEKGKVINKEIITDTYKLLRSEEGRVSFTEKLNSFTGVIEADSDGDFYIDTFTGYESGVISSFRFSSNLYNIPDFNIVFDINGAPVMCKNTMEIHWERYPSVNKIVNGNETFLFGPVFLLYAPLSFVQIGGSDTSEGLLYPELEGRNFITRQAILSFCSSLTRPSAEISSAKETIYMSRGVILQAAEEVNGAQVSVTEFQRGLPVIQYIDTDQDGRMETIRRFRRPPANYVWEDLLDYRRLIASSESDFRGDGRYMTREVYSLDGSVVYYSDMDGSGEMKRQGTGNR